MACLSSVGPVHCRVEPEQRTSEGFPELSLGLARYQSCCILLNKAIYRELMYKEWGNSAPLSPFFTLQWDRHRHGKQRTVIISSNISTPLRPAFPGHAASLDRPMVFLLLWVLWHRMPSSMNLNFLLWDWSLTGLLTSPQTGRNLSVVRDTVWWVGSVLGFVLRQQLMKLPKLVSNSCYSCLGKSCDHRCTPPYSAVDFYLIPSVCVYELDLICQEHLVTSPFIYFLINHIFMPILTFAIYFILEVRTQHYFFNSSY